MVGVAAGRTSPATEHKQLAPTAVLPTYVYIPVTPNRLVDSRFNVGLSGPLKSRIARTFQVTNRNPSNPALNIPNAAIGETTMPFSSAMPSANYHVAWMITSDTDWGGSSGWGYIFVTSKTANGFTLHLNDDDGGAKNAPADVTVDRIALPAN